MSDRVGQQLGHYRLVRLLGRGGFAEVYLGEHIHLGTQAAIKLLHTQLSAKDATLFQQEARMIARLNHPHIVRVLDFGIEENTLYLVMSFAQNGTLRDRHPKGERIPLATIIEYIMQVADGLQYAHDQRIIHRDIKPENMLIGRRGEVLLSDFGIAVLAQSTSSASAQTMAGTISYMAPEQISAHPRLASDQYSLAIVVYEWLYGQCPFQGGFTEVAVKQQLTPPPPLLTLVPGLPLAVEEVVMRALAKTPEQRFPSIRAFAQALQQASLTSVTVPPPPPTVNHDQSRQKANVGYVSVPPVSITPRQQTIPTAGSAPMTFSPQAIKQKRPSRRVLLLAGMGIVGGGLAIYGASSLFSSLSQTVLTYTGHSNGVNSLAWSPHDGKLIVSGGIDTTVQVWDAFNGGSPLIKYQSPFISEHVQSVCWSPDGQYFAFGGFFDRIQVWNARGEVGLRTTHRIAYTIFLAIAWSPDGQYLASASSDLNKIQIWNALIDGVPTRTYQGHNASVKALAWSPDGQYLASGGNDQQVQVWKASGADQKALVTHAHTSTVWTLAWSPDGQYLASASGNEVHVWQPDLQAGTEKLIASYKGHSDEVLKLDWSPDGKKIASGGRDKTVQIWTALTGGSALFTYREHSSDVWAIAWSPDGQHLASGGFDKTVKVWKAP